MLLLQAPSQSMRIGTTNSRNLSQMLSQHLRPTLEPNPLRRWYRSGSYFLEDNWRRCWVLLVWFSICAGLFAWKFVQYRRRAVFEVMGYCLPTAKGAAETLKLNMALVLLPVCRNTLTWLRSSWARFFVPFDDNITFHKVRQIVLSPGLVTQSDVAATRFGIFVESQVFGASYRGRSWWFGRRRRRRGAVVCGVSCTAGGGAWRVMIGRSVEHRRSWMDHVCHGRTLTHVVARPLPSLYPVPCNPTGEWTV
jgi:hypothetical protein